MKIWFLVVSGVLALRSVADLSSRDIEKITFWLDECQALHGPEDLPVRVASHVHSILGWIRIKPHIVRSLREDIIRMLSGCSQNLVSWSSALTEYEKSCYLYIGSGIRQILNEMHLIDEELSSLASQLIALGTELTSK